MRFDYIIFDFDGTVADTGLGVKNAVKYALLEHGITVGDESKLDYFIGPPLYEGFEHVYGVSPELANSLVDSYRVYYAEKGVYECSVYPGTMELLKLLKHSGAKVAVASSKPKHFLDVVVPYIGASEYFDFIVGPELKNHNSNKSVLIAKSMELMGAEDKSKIIMLGDRKYDIEGAHEVGIQAVGIEYGYGTREELLSAGADYIATNVNELKNILL